MMGGAWVNSGTPLPAVGYFLNNDGTNADFWIQQDDGYTKGVRIELQQNGSDIDARATAAKFTRGGNVPFDFNNGGNGAQTLAGNSNYSGGTTISEGTVIGAAGVQFDGTQGGALGTGEVTVESGATLRTAAAFVAGGGQNTTRTVNVAGTLDISGDPGGGEYIRTLNLTGGLVTADLATMFFRAPNGGMDLSSRAAAESSIPHLRRPVGGR